MWSLYMNAFKWKTLIFPLTPTIIVLLFFLGELIFLNLHLGEGKIWGTKKYKGYYKVIPHGRIGDTVLFDDFPKDLKPVINSKGFRGKEFKDQPEKGGLRIICIGESSTFGFHNSDSKTYPAQLEEYLKRKFPDKSIEVINAGIPMININGMKNCFKYELVKYKPDIITLYTYYNDVIDSTYSKNFISWLYNFIYKNTEFGVWITRQIKSIMRKNPDKGEKFLPKINKEEILTSTKNAKKFYFFNLKEIVNICNKNKILLLVIKQPTGKPQSYLDLNKKFLNLSYEEKKLYYRKKLEKEGTLNILESKFYIQRELSKSLRKFISNYNLKLLNFSTIAEKHLEWFAGPVHLNPTGNKHLAKAIGDMIISQRILQ